MPYANLHSKLSFGLTRLRPPNDFDSYLILLLLSPFPETIERVSSISFPNRIFHRLVRKIEHQRTLFSSYYPSL